MKKSRTKTIGGLGLGINRTREIAEHFVGLPLSAIDMEFRYFSLIHPTGQEDVEQVLKNAIQYTIDLTHENPLNQIACKNESGIYGIMLDEKTIYIGETIKSFESRLNQHIDDLKNNNHHNRKMLREYNKLKDKKFTFVIFESSEVEEDSRAHFKLYSLFRERYYQELFYINGYKILNLKDSLKEIYSDYCFEISTPSMSRYFASFAYGEEKYNSPYIIQDTLKKNSNIKLSLFEQKTFKEIYFGLIKY